MADPAVPVRLSPGRVFEPVERALAGQGGAALAAGSGLVAEKARYGIVAQAVVIVQILEAEGEGHDALGYQRGDGVFGEPGVAVVGEAGGDAVEQVHRPPAFPEQQRSGVGGDRAAVERGRDFAAPAALKDERDGLTPCRHRSSLLVAAMFLYKNNLATTGGRCLLHPARNPG